MLGILGAIAVSTTQKAWPAFAKEGLTFVFTDNWNPSQEHFGALALIYGTIVVSLIAVVIAVPVSIGIALFMTEVASRRFRPAITTVMDLLAAIPSVVFGLWGFLVPAAVPEGRLQLDRTITSRRIPVSTASSVPACPGRAS